MDPEQISIHTSHSFRSHDGRDSEKVSLDDPRNSVDRTSSHAQEQDDQLSQHEQEQQQDHQQQQAPATAPSSGLAESLDPPPFSSHNFPSLYFPPPQTSATYDRFAEQSPNDSLPAFAPAPPFEQSSSSAVAAVVADTKVEVALARDTKHPSSSKDLDDGEPPPPYTEGSSPLDGFTYVMAAAGGAASIITQVSQGGPAPINTLAGSSDEHITLDLRYGHY